MWQTHNHCVTKAASQGRRLIRINLDETSVCAFQEPSVGVVFDQQGRLAQQDPLRVSGGAKRLNLAYVALLAEAIDVQATLPQVIIGSHRSFLRRNFEDLWTASPHFIYLIRSEGKACNNHDNMRKILELLAAVRTTFWLSLIHI